MSENDDSHKGEGNPNKNQQPTPNKPKKIKKFGGKNDPSRSKSAPAETFEDQEEPDNNYIASYNYYLYYNSIKPVDPRLPKPTYTPKPNLEFIRESKKELEEDENIENSNENLQVGSLTNEILALAMAGQIDSKFIDQKEALKAGIFIQSHLSFCVKDNIETTGSIGLTPFGELKLLLNGAMDYIQQEEVEWIENT